MTKGKTSSPATDAGDLLHAAWRNAKFAAQVELRRSKGKDPHGKPRFSDEDVLAEASKIFIATSANMIATGMTDITGDIPKTTILASTIDAPQIQQPQAQPPIDPSIAARLEQERAEAEQRKHINYKAELRNLLASSLNKVLNEQDSLSATDKDNIQKYFEQAHPGHPNVSVQKASERKRLSREDRRILKGVLRSDIAEYDRQKSQHSTAR